MNRLILPGQEVTFAKDAIIVSKTDPKGIITYTNPTFREIAGYTETELLGKPHSIIRHEAMPRCVFKLIWDYVQAGHEIFGYVVNKTKDGNYYWVLAHVTPSLDNQQNMIGYHSTRRVPDKNIVDTIINPLYAQLLEIENSVNNRKDGMMKAHDHLIELLNSKGIDYDRFILTL
ncbi:MAG: PAS domain S-box protein [Alphaproteobacteria bacterium]|nr:PAS domain S-box protein [Alphaproteobacteria bacterium]MCB9985430.1 PAS domain S-box protein [Micavibrio sp.]HPQ51227.1 PAS domain S-box protein [Alphaproteobacteria bacterium]HRK98557.1 PAS domain S-box protein [Alphaproteobacteria bacterium]